MDENEKLFKQLYPWWLKLAESNIIVIYKNKKYEMIKMSKSKKKYEQEIKKLDINNNVEAIIWSGMSIDVLELFIKFLSKNNFFLKNELTTSNQIIDLILKNYKKFFYKYKILSNKEYTFKNDLRPSPTASATLFELGKKKRGNDGNMYIIVVNKNGVKRWKKIS